MTFDILGRRQRKGVCPRKRSRGVSRHKVIQIGQERSTAKDAGAE